ncbi:EAL domain-containing protein [Metabacillus niabensis]|uniref:sensor domain-containing protein n=1 Tax=Metabacillus niabensis TaxID=324854 RepID=UPI0011AB04F5
MSDEGLGILLNDVINHINGALMITDEKGSIVYINPRFTNLFGYTENEILGKSPKLLQSTKNDHFFYTEFWNKLLKDGSWEGEMWNKNKSGDINPYWLSITAFKNEHSVVKNYIALYQDLSNRKIVEEDMRNLAYTDSLTGLPNRRLFKKILEQEIIESTKTRGVFGVLFIDLNRFKLINDTLGHQVGDTLLKEVARRIKNSVRTTDTVARMGGDEFTVLLPHLQDQSNAIIVCKKIEDQMEEPFILAEKEFHIGLSIGISIFPHDATESGDLMRKSDIAMFRAKQEGGGYRFFIEDMSIEGRERLEIENDLRKALEQNEFELHYQPQININSNEIYGVEALLRWNHPVKGYISPAVFIPIAEELGLIPAIGKWVLYTACKQNKKWQDSGYKPIVVAVNLSPKQFKKKDVLHMIQDVLIKSQLDPKYLELELTESGIAEKPEYVIDTLTELKKIGVRIAVDDFGTGYSSLSHLKQFPIDYLKIDRSFICDINQDGEPISTAIIDMARSLKMGVIAEGVETEDQLEFLKRQGCKNMQGYYFSKPLPASELKEKLIKL